MDKVAYFNPYSYKGPVKEKVADLAVSAVIAGVMYLGSKCLPVQPLSAIATFAAGSLIGAASALGKSVGDYFELKPEKPTKEAGSFGLSWKTGLLMMSFAGGAFFLTQWNVSRTVPYAGRVFSLMPQFETTAQAAIVGTTATVAMVAGRAWFAGKSKTSN